MTAYANVGVKTIIVYPPENDETEATDPSTSKDVADFITSLDATSEKVIAITETKLDMGKIKITIMYGA